MANKILDALKSEFTPKGQLKSVRWYQDQVRSLSNVTPNSLMANKERLVTNLSPGFMYLYFYDPKYKETLPYYDTFPLCLPFKTTPEGFYGLNFHYLPYQARMGLLSRLMEFRSNNKMDEKTKIMASWKILQQASTISFVKPAVHQYLYAHVRSRYMKINANEWATSIMLPIQQFEKATDTKVWADSRKKMG